MLNHSVSVIQLDRTGKLYLLLWHMLERPKGVVAPRPDTLYKMRDECNFEWKTARGLSKYRSAPLVAGSAVLHAAIR